jgi:hypothetical protein
MDAIHRQIYILQQDYFRKQPLGTILVSHRAAGLPGFCQRLEAADQCPRADSWPKAPAPKAPSLLSATFPGRKDARACPSSTGNRVAMIDRTPPLPAPNARQSR